jgi:hypothetical protein
MLMRSMSRPRLLFVFVAANPTQPGRRNNANPSRRVGGRIVVAARLRLPGRSPGAGLLLALAEVLAQRGSPTPSPILRSRVWCGLWLVCHDPSVDNPTIAKARLRALRPRHKAGRLLTVEAAERPAVLLQQG